MKLQYKITLLMSAMLIVVFGSIALMVGEHFTDNLENQMGNSAMDMALTIAQLDEVSETLATKSSYWPLQDKIDRIKEKTRFQYIIVMDMDGIQYTYPYTNGLGKRYKNGGEARVLESGESYVSADRNVLISAIRAFTPVYYDGKQVGAVLVGLLTDRVHKENESYLNKIHLAICYGGILGIFGAMMLARNIKKSTYGLEPKEIGLLLGQREIILESLRWGIMAVDSDYKINWINKVATEEFSISQNALNEDVRTKFPKLGDIIERVMETGEPEYNVELRIHSALTLISSHTITRNPNGDIMGVVSSFEDMSQVKSMAEELIGYKKMTNALRAQNHEFMNKLHTISGLIQLNELDDALDFISDESSRRIELSSILSDNIKMTRVAAILMAKYSQVTEAKYKMIIDSDSSLERIPAGLHEDELCSVIGNLVDNAREAFSSGVGDEIYVGIFTMKKALRLIVKDNGPGIPASMLDRIYERGITTKSASRGVGLNIVRDIIDNAGGVIRITVDGGTSFVIDIPWSD